MVPPLVLLCLQLIMVTTSSSWALESHAAHPRLEALFSAPSFPPAAAAAKPLSPGVHRTSKRGLLLPTLIDSGDNGYAYRQHHQPPPSQHQQHPLAGEEGGHFYGPQERFQQQQHHHQGYPHQHRYPQQQQPQPVEIFPDEELQDYDQLAREVQFNPEGPGSSIEGDTNEIGDNPFFGPAGGGGGGAEPATGHSNLESIDLIREQLERVKEEEDIEIKSNLLMKLLEQLPEGPLPVVYIEDAGGSDASENGADNNGGDDGTTVGEVEHFTANGDKRSGRYYRRYPWKRQNARSRTYDADARYLCVPSRDDVFKLLVGLHENRIGNHQKTINFCNRKRPAKAIFTNIRFLG